MAYISITEARRITGCPEELKTDEEISDIIDLVEKQAEGYFGVKFTPTKTIDFERVYDLNNIKLNNLKVMTIQDIYLNEVQQDKTFWTFDENLGKLQKNKEYNNWTYFAKNEPYRLKVKYTHAMLDTDSPITESTANVSTGTSVVIAVEDETDFNLRDYVRIKGFDGYNEVAQITAIASNQLTVDKLFYEHESGSVITSLALPEIVRQFILYETAVAVAINVVGASYTIATSYSYPEYTVTKGVPYPHWEKNANANSKKRDELEKAVWALKSTIL